MRDFSNELCITILEYLQKEDQIEWGICCRRWYQEVMRNHVRILPVNLRRWSSEEQFQKLLVLIPRLIRVPSKQLEVLVSQGKQSSHQFCKLLESVHYTLKELDCPTRILMECTSMKEGHTFYISHLRTSTGDLASELLGTNPWTVFNRFHSIERLSLTTQNCYLHVPDLLSVKELFLCGPIQITSLLHSQFSLSRLRKLSLRQCAISDVRMLGSIPDLLLGYCPSITGDISTLNDNFSISILHCKNIYDFSRSFRNSQVIKLYITCQEIPLIDTTHWQKVEILEIQKSHTMNTAIDTEIPITVRNYHCKGILFANMELTRWHALQVLKIDNSPKLSPISSLKGLGMEQLRLIELINLFQLNSLQGLGSSRNQRVVIKGCPLITDYSPLRNVSEVMIESTRNVYLDHLDHVYTLTIVAEEVFIEARKSYTRINELNLFVSKALSGVQGIERIPYLTIGYQSIYALRDFLSAGGRISSQKIIVAVYCLSSGLLYSSDKDKIIEEGLAVYQRYLCQDYILRKKGTQLIMLQN